MRLVIVEDEIRIRDGLKKLIPKINSEYEIVGEAINGEEGIEVIKKTLPDLIITDVCMPELNGLEMITRLIGENYKFKTIILSAYSEFPYAKKAIGLGVSEYLLKPIKVVELRRCLQNIEASVSLENNLESEAKLFGSLKDIFYQLLFRSFPLNSEVGKLLEKRFNINLESEFAEVIFYLGNNYNKIKDKIVNRTNKILKEKYTDQYCLIKLESEQSLLLIIFSEEINNSFEKWFEYTAMPYISGEYISKICFGLQKTNRLSQLKKGYEQIKDNLDWNIVLDDEELISDTKIDQIKTKSLSYPIEVENQMKTALCALEFDKTGNIIQEFLRYLQEEDLYSPKDIKQNCCRFLWSMLNIANELGVIKSNNFKNQEYLARIKTAVLKRELIDSLLQVKKRFSEDKYSDQSKTSIIIVKAKSMIHEFYKKGITLKEIAEKLDITPEYLGMLFHKETGTNFSSYLNNYRIDKARALLIGTDLKLYEIAELVGYNDAKYFSRVFKKTTCQSPAEYRSINK